jgi:hypothetical protein
VSCLCGAAQNGTTKAPVLRVTTQASPGDLKRLTTTSYALAPHDLGPLDLVCVCVCVCLAEALHGAVGALS